MIFFASCVNCSFKSRNKNVHGKTSGGLPEQQTYRYADCYMLIMIRSYLVLKLNAMGKRQCQYAMLLHNRNQIVSPN